MGGIIGYARTSTIDQKAGLEAQQRDLRAAGCQQIYSEQVSSVAERAQLEIVLATLTAGDTLMVTKPDRLSRSTAHFLELVEDLTKRDVGLVILSMGGERLDTRKPMSKLIMTVLVAVAAWEREAMLERQLEGIAKARQEGKYKGRKPPPDSLIDSVIQCDAEGLIQADIAVRCKTSISTVGRIIRAHKCREDGHILLSAPAFAHNSNAVDAVFE